MFHQKPHHEDSHNCVARVIGEPDRNETEDEGMHRPPEPEILVQDVKSTNRDHQQCSLHCGSLAAIGEMSVYYGMPLEKIATGSRGC